MKVSMATKHRARQAGITPARVIRRESPKEVATLRLPDFPVVGLGASAGGLETFTKLLEALSADIGMAFVLIQHLDPTHKSLMVELLSKHTAMKVLQASDAMPLERNHVYTAHPMIRRKVRDDVYAPSYQ